MDQREESERGIREIRVCMVLSPCKGVTPGLPGACGDLPNLSNR